MTLIGRGQVHVFERASGLYGAVVRFGDELLHGDAAARANPAWLLGGRGARTVAVPAGDVPRLEAAIEALAAETRRPADACSVDLQRHFLSALLLWVERWYEASRTQQRDADDAEVQLYRRFVDVLERDFARHHDAAHYADALRVPQAALSRALARVTGRATKELITDRADARGRAAAAVHRPDGRRDRVPRRLRRPALLLARVQAPPRRGADGLPRAGARAERPCIRPGRPFSGGGAGRP